MPTTSDLRRWWAPACSGPWRRLSLYGTGVITVRAQCADAFMAIDAIMRKWNYRTERHHTGAYNCRKITGGSGYSLHAYGIAADYNWQRNPYSSRLITDMPPGMVAEIEALRTNTGKVVFRWGGRYRNNKDAMHYEIFCAPQDLASGIRNGTTPAPPPTSPTSEEDDMLKLVKGSGPAIYSTDFVTKTHLSGPALQAIQYVNAIAGGDAKVNTVPQDLLDSLPTNIDVGAAVQLIVGAINAKIDGLNVTATLDTAAVTAAVKEAVEGLTGADAGVIADELARRLQG